MYYEHFDFTLPFFFTVPDTLSPKECTNLIEQAEAGDWLDATVNSFGGRVVKRQIRDNTLALVPNGGALARTLYTRLLAHIPETFRGRERVGIVPSLRVYRYQPGQHFGPHQDQSYTHGGHQSAFSFLVYLNQDFLGGQTDFLDLRECVAPKTGMALFFQHKVLHQGRRVEEGTKYLLRSDILYRDSEA